MLMMMNLIHIQHYIFDILIYQNLMELDNLLLLEYIDASFVCNLIYISHKNRKYCNIDN